MTSSLAARSDFGLTGRPVSFDAGLRVLGLYDWSSLGVTYRVEATLSDTTLLGLHVFGSAACPSEESVQELLTELGRHERSRPSLNSGRLSDGRPGVLFPFEHAHLLADLIDEQGRALDEQTRPLDPGFAVRLVASICEELARHGLPHGELSPRCILLRPGSSHFELSRVLGYGFHPALDRLFEGGLPGSLVEYRAPERFQGYVPSLRSDVFALGSVLLRLLASSFPAAPLTVEDAQRRALAPDFDPTAGVLNQVPEAIQPLIARALQASPDARYSSPAEFGRALLAASTGWPVQEQSFPELPGEPAWVSPAIMYPELGRLTRSQAPDGHHSSIREVSQAPFVAPVHYSRLGLNSTALELTCARCGKPSPEHYKFCLGCGADLPRAGRTEQRRSDPPSAERRGDGFLERTPPRGILPGPERAETRESDPDAGWTDLAWSAPVETRPPPSGAVRVMPTIPITASPLGEAEEPLILPEEVLPPSDSQPVFSEELLVDDAETAVPERVATFGLGGLEPARNPASASLAPPRGLIALNRDGSTRAHFMLEEGSQLMLGARVPAFSEDPFLSEDHIQLELRQGRLYVRDAQSVHGVYLKLPPHDPREIVVGDYLRVGQQVLRLDPPPEELSRLGARLVRVSEDNGSEEGVIVNERGTTCGRERGHLLFPEDGFVSSLHCRIILMDGKFYLTDLGSSNGTFIRLREESELQPGQLLLMGQQLLRVES